MGIGEVALGLAIASLIYSVVLSVKVKDTVIECTWDPKQDWTCNCPLCQHAKGLSEEAIQDIIKGAIPEIHEDGKDKK